MAQTVLVDLGVRLPARSTAGPRAPQNSRSSTPAAAPGTSSLPRLQHLVPIRIAEEGLSAAEAVDAVLRDNLTAWRSTSGAARSPRSPWRLPPGPTPKPAATGRCPTCRLPAPALDLRPQRISGPDWPRSRACRCRRTERARVKNGLLNLRRLFSLAPTLGSLINPAELRGDLFAADYETIRPHLAAVLEAEKSDDETRERAIAADGMVKAAGLLAGKYTFVITNVPYLGKGSHDEHLIRYAAALDPDAASDLAYIMLTRIDRMVCENGTYGLVIPQAWMYLSSYLRLRRKYLNRREFNLVARLGPGAFETISGEVVQCALTVISDTKPDVDRPFAILDAAAKPGDPELGVAEKSRILLGVHGGGERQVRFTTPRTILDSPSSKFSFSTGASDGWLSDFADSFVGLQTGDSRAGSTCSGSSAASSNVDAVQLAPARTTAVDGCTAALRWDMQDELRHQLQGLEFKDCRHLANLVFSFSAWRI